MILAFVETVSFRCGVLMVTLLIRSVYDQARIKAHELRGKSKEDLLKQLNELKTELSQLRVAKVTGGAASKLGKM